MGLPVLRTLSLCTCCRQYPGAAAGRRLRSSHPAVSAFPETCGRVGLHIDLFEACAAFTRVAARTLAPSPICDALHRRLQPFRHLHDCSGCFQLERSPGGALTHWKAPPCHGAHVKRSFENRRVPSSIPLTARCWGKSIKGATSGAPDRHDAGSYVSEVSRCESNPNAGLRRK